MYISSAVGNGFIAGLSLTLDRLILKKHFDYGKMKACQLVFKPFGSAICNHNNLYQYSSAEHIIAFSIMTVSNVHGIITIIIIIFSPSDKAPTPGNLHGL